MSRSASPKPPLGELESETLEFKGRDVLKDLGTVGRVVVALLNAKGGDFWIGIAESDGRAATLEPVSGVEREARRVRDFLADSIEPSLSDEVKVDTPDGLLHVTVKPVKKCQPYAHVSRGERHFLIRIGDRTRPTTREEIFERHGSPHGSGTDRLTLAREGLSKLRSDAIKRFPQHLWLCVQPVGTMEVDVQSEGLRELLMDPRRSGNRPAGWVFADRYKQPELKNGRIESGSEGGKHTEICRDGSIEFRIPLPGLHWKGEPGSLWPYCLLEYPVSVLRLVSALLEMTGAPTDDGRFVIRLALSGLRGWKLGPHSPESLSFQVCSYRQFQEDDPDVEPNLLVRGCEEIIKEADRCAFSLVRSIYEAFGYEEDKIPVEFDRTTKRLVLSE